VFSKNYISADKGNVSVEFAFVLPIFLIFIFGTFWIGWVTYGTYSVHHALVQSARALQIKPTTTQSELQAIVRGKVDAVGGATNVTVTLNLDPVDSTGTQLAHATASYPLSFTVPLLGTYTFNYSTSMTVAVTAS
jgi:Flp pilus assembly protein TadG